MTRGLSTANGNVRFVIGIGDVVEVGFVDENRRVGRLAIDPRKVLARRAGADVRGGRVVRIAIEHQSRTLRGIRQLVQIDLEVRVEPHGPHRVAHHLRVAGTLLVGRDRADERPVLRRKQVRRRSKNLCRAAAEDDVLRFDALFLRDRVDEILGLAGVPAWRPASVPERGLHGVEHRPTRSDRILVAGQDDDARFDRVQRWLERRPQRILAAARADPRTGEGASRADADRLDEAASRQRHVASWVCAPVDVEIGRSTFRNTAVAFSISSIVPMETRT